ncbi:hypothetical protein A2U01_0093805 [Trifolium medium]|uniref:Uncharacterized protein n=1 Tax=Trifolium medium TaxID=97028 RepID=A0A392UGI6_9FABA|nr:hypothetical protein [Trifolium medium]
MSGNFAWGAEVGGWGETAMVEAMFCSGKSAWGAGSHAGCESLMP